MWDSSCLCGVYGNLTTSLGNTGKPRFVIPVPQDHIVHYYSATLQLGLCL